MSAFHPKRSQIVRTVRLLPLFLGAAQAALGAQYDFLSVSGNNVAGNGASTTFTSNANNGVITVTHSFSSPAAVGYGDNNNSLIYPSQFTTLFPGTGLVQGHLAMTVYGDPNSPTPGGNINTSTVVFNLTGYFGNLPSLVFGIWNTTDEVTLPVYDIKIKDAGSNIVAPPFNLFGNQDNQTQVAGRHMMQMDAFGNITAPTLLNIGGTHTDAMFFDGIPTGTQEIIVTANLPPLNLIGDGVGYYFAEIVPEPSSFVLAAAGAATLAWAGLRRGRKKNQPA